MWSLLAVVLLSLVVITRAGDVSTDYFECYPNQTIKFTNPDSGLYTYYKAFYDAAGPGTETDCVVAADDANNYAFMDCASTTATVTLYISDRDLSGDNNILSKNSTTFTFNCMTEASHNKTLTNTLNVNISEAHESAFPDYNITSAFFDGSGNLKTQATVGDTVFFIITGPADYNLKPLQCNASGSANENAIIVTDGCSQDKDLIQDFTETTVDLETHYNASIYVFKFYNSDTVTLTCNVQVCSDGADCSFDCSGAGRRKREVTITNEFKRDVNDVNDDYKTSMTGSTLRILDVALGGSVAISGSAQYLIFIPVILFTMFW